MDGRAERTSLPPPDSSPPLCLMYIGGICLRFCLGEKYRDATEARHKEVSLTLKCCALEKERPRSLRPPAQPALSALPMWVLDEHLNFRTLRPVLLIELQGLSRRGHIGTEGRSGGRGGDRLSLGGQSPSWGGPPPTEGARGQRPGARPPTQPARPAPRPPPQPRAPRGRRPPGRRRQRGGAAKKGLICSAFHQQLGGLPRPTGWVPGRLPPSVGRRRDHRAALPSAFLPRECVSDSRRRA